MTAPLADVVATLDSLLNVGGIPDYPNALNGLQFAHRGPIVRVATAVDASQRTIMGAARAGANLLIVHHGLFWGGVVPLTGHHFNRIRLLLEHDIAVYSVHLPLDVHPVIGNSRLLAMRLGLQVCADFAVIRGVACGVRGKADIATSDLCATIASFTMIHGGKMITSEISPGRRTQHWAICSGAGVDQSILAEAAARDVDTLIVGEGPHWSAVEAPERNLVIVYAGHYATETLGVMALGEHLHKTFGLPHDFVAAPTSL